MKTINTTKAPQAIGPYVQAKVISNFVFTSGQIPLKADGSIVSGNFELECIQVLDNIREILKAAGSSMANIIKLTIYLTDLENFSILNKVFEDYWTFPSELTSTLNPLPARSTVEVSRLPKNARVEIEAIGFINA